MSLFDELEGMQPDVSVNLDEFGSVAAMNMAYERYLLAGKYGVFTLKLGNHSGMIPMDVKFKSSYGDWAETEVEEITIAIDGGWELWDLLQGCKMIVTTEELHGKLA